MFRWSRFPFLRIAFVYIIGILVARLVDTTIPFYVLWICILMGALGLIFSRTNLQKILLGNTLLVFMGLLGYINYSEKRSIDAIENLDSVTACTGIIYSYPFQKGNYTQYNFETRFLQFDSLSFQKKVKIRLYVDSKSDQSLDLKYGDLIAISNGPFQIPGPKNPNEFDYAGYMKDKGILYQQFTRVDQIQRLSSNHGNPLLTAVYRLRNHFSKILEKQLTGKNERAVAMALLLGKKDELGADIKEAYASAGAMHVLAVSGLHVGVIYFMIGWLFKRVRIKWVERILVPFITLAILWLYALLTGFSPSIFRSVVMFSAIVIGSSFNRQTNIYNSIAVSAFVLLLVDPMNLFFVGFQLSYLAVFGIVFFYSKFYPLLTGSNWLFDKIWSLCCISLAAQLATAPISVFYFNQFPTYFLFSNLIVIPMAFIIMNGGIALLALGSFNLFHWIGAILEWLIRLLNTSVEFIENLPYSTYEWIYFSPTQVLIVYAILASLAIFLFYQKKRFLWLGFTFAWAFSLDRSMDIYHQSQKSNLIFYSTRENLLIDHVKGLIPNLMVLDTIENKELAAFQIEPNRIKTYQPPIQEPTILKNSSMQLGDFAALDVKFGKKFLYLFDDLPANKTFQLSCDYLILCDEKLNPKNSIDHLSYENVIIKSSIPYHKANLWEKYNSGKVVSVYNLKTHALTLQNPKE